MGPDEESVPTRCERGRSTSWAPGARRHRWPRRANCQVADPDPEGPDPATIDPEGPTARPSPCGSLATSFETAPLSRTRPGRASGPGQEKRRTASREEDHPDRRGEMGGPPKGRIEGLGSLKASSRRSFSVTLNSRRPSAWASPAARWCPIAPILFPQTVVPREGDWPPKR